MRNIVLVNYVLIIPTVLVPYIIAVLGFVRSDVPIVIMIPNAARVKCVVVSIFIIKVTALNLVQIRVNLIATVHQGSTVVVLVRSENVLRLALESHVSITIVVQVESLVVQMANAPSLVLERRAIIPHIVQQMNIVVIALAVQVNVLLLVLENRVNMIHTAQLMDIVVA